LNIWWKYSRDLAQSGFDAQGVIAPAALETRGRRTCSRGRSTQDAVRKMDGFGESGGNSRERRLRAESVEDAIERSCDQTSDACGGASGNAITSRQRKTKSARMSSQHEPERRRSTAAVERHR
jgi:hypothetical protein